MAKTFPVMRRGAGWTVYEHHYLSECMLEDKEIPFIKSNTPEVIRQRLNFPLDFIEYVKEQL